MVFLFLLLFILMGRLSYVMIGKAEEYKDMAKDQWTSGVKIAPKRGKILDRNGMELAVSADVYRVDADLNALRTSLENNGKTFTEITPGLAERLDMEEEKVYKELTRTLQNGKLRGSAILKRRVEKKEADELRDYIINEDLYGIKVSPDSKRYYPNNNFLSHVLGHTNSDGKGLMGVELVYDDELSGIPGYKLSEMDARRNSDMPYSISDYTKPVQGQNVVLTIDEQIQFFVEKAAEQAVVDNNAKAVTIVAMDPNNGEILALANKPDYNLNDPWVSDDYNENQKTWRNMAVNDAFEPGSIFKIVTAVAALSENKVNPETDVFVCNGGVKFAGHTVHCHKRTGHGAQSFADILKNSCNVGFMELGERLGPELLNKYIKLFGFGKKTGVDLNGEAGGIIKKTEDMKEIDVATISFGQTNTVSVMQFMRAVNAVANGGKLLTPHVMKEITRYDENNNTIVDKTYVDKNDKRIIDENIAVAMRKYLEYVVSDGAGNQTYIPGYHIGGKTGTAQKVVNGVYGSGKYISSFVGMAPADKPIITLMVSIDEPDPSKYYASQTAAPVAKQVFNDIFNYLSFKPDAEGEEIARSMLKDVIVPEVRGVDKKEALKILTEEGLNYRIDGKGKFISDINPKPGYSVKEGTEIIIYTSDSEEYNNMVVLPNLKNMDNEKATIQLESLGLYYNFIGDGLVSDQVPKAGSVLEKGTTVTVYLEPLTD